VHELGARIAVLAIELDEYFCQRDLTPLPAVCWVIGERWTLPTIRETAYGVLPRKRPTRSRSARKRRCARPKRGEAARSGGHLSIVVRLGHGIVSGGCWNGPMPAFAFAIATVASSGVMNPAATSAFTAVVNLDA
jgi:hypothetical protein